MLPEKNVKNKNKAGRKEQNFVKINAKKSTFLYKNMVKMMADGLLFQKLQILC